MFLFLAISLISCFEKEVFPDTPRIGFEDIAFYDNARTDSLILIFSFEDGNGDIGIIESQDKLPPFNEFDVYIDSRDSVITEDNIGEAVAPIYTAPLIAENWRPVGIVGNTLVVDFTENDFPILGFDKDFFSEDVSDIPFTCPGLTNQSGILFDTTTLTVYNFGEQSSIVPSDAGRQSVAGQVLPVLRNETYYNFVIEFERRVGSGYEPLDFKEIFGTNLCDFGIFNGRIPLYDPDGKSGVFTYAMQSQVFTLAFQDNIVRARFYVYDRAGNRSNIASTPDFILSDITQ